MHMKVVKLHCILEAKHVIDFSNETYDDIWMNHVFNWRLNTIKIL